MSGRLSLYAGLLLAATQHRALAALEACDTSALEAHVAAAICASVEDPDEAERLTRVLAERLAAPDALPSAPFRALSRRDLEPLVEAARAMRAALAALGAKVAERLGEAGATETLLDAVRTSADAPKSRKRRREEQEAQGAYEDDDDDDDDESSGED